jgi:hypothetical protein
MALWAYWHEYKRYNPPSGMKQYVYVPVFIGYDPTKDVTVLHYRPDIRDVEMDIHSYRDLQRYSDSVSPGNGIGREHPFFHVKEEFQGHEVDYQLTDYLNGRRKVADFQIAPAYVQDNRWNDIVDNGNYIYQIGDGKVAICTCNHWHDGSNERGRMWVDVNEYRVKSEHPDVPGREYRMYSRGSGTILREFEFKGRHTTWPQFPVQDIISEADVLCQKKEFTPGMWCDDYYWRRMVSDKNWLVTSNPGFNPENDYKILQPQHLIPAGLEAKACADAFANTAFNSNSIANGLELFDLASSIKSGRIFSDIVKKGHIFETSKNAWLAYRYSYSTTMSDIEELGRYIEQGSQTVCRSRVNTDYGIFCTKVITSPKRTKLNETIDRLTSAGVAPNLYNLWDMVPYSFVVDWFADIGGILESITQYGRCAAYDIVSVTSSWKWVDYIEKGGITAKLTYYRRYVDRHCPPYVPYIEESTVGDSTKLKRVFDSVALFT